MIIGVQSIHQVRELSITIGSKVIQEEDFATYRIVHLIGKSTDLIDNGAEHCALSVNESVCEEYNLRSEIEHV